MPGDSTNKSKLEETLTSTTPSIPEEVTAWLGRLVLLYGVPFHYLIPEEAMLPKESLRFFFLDPIWMQCLVQGACSVGSNGYGDRIIDTVMNEWMQPNQPDDNTQASLANKQAASVRDRLREQYEGIPLPAEDTWLHWPLTGFLFRSTVVESWRGLEVMAYRNLTVQEKQQLPDNLSGKVKDIYQEAIGNKRQKDELRSDLRDLLRKKKPEKLTQLFRLAGVPTQEAFLKLVIESVTPLKPLRIEQLSKGVMLGLFNGIIAHLVIRQPQEGLHFGLTPSGQSYDKTLRELGNKNPGTAGQLLTPLVIDLAKDKLLREQDYKGVIKVTDLANKIQSLLSKAGQLENDKFTSAEFAVEMIEAAGEFTFRTAIETAK